MRVTPVRKSAGELCTEDGLIRVEYKSRSKNLGLLPMIREEARPGWRSELDFDCEIKYAKVI
jgi:hypothetical protein